MYYTDFVKRLSYCETWTHIVRPTLYIEVQCIRSHVIWTFLLLYCQRHKYCIQNLLIHCLDSFIGTKRDGRRFCVLKSSSYEENLDIKYCYAWVLSIINPSFKFFLKLRRYSQVKVQHRYQRQRWQMCHRRLKVLLQNRSTTSFKKGIQKLLFSVSHDSPSK